MAAMMHLDGTAAEETVQFLIELGADLQTPARFISKCSSVISDCPMYITALHFACDAGKLVRVLMLLVT
jgi:hypothetical protein